MIKVDIGGHIRKRKCCTMCLSVHIIKSKKNGDYFCERCNFVFTTPSLRGYQIMNFVPCRLKVIMKKQEEEVGKGKNQD